MHSFLFVSRYFFTQKYLALNLLIYPPESTAPRSFDIRPQSTRSLYAGDRASKEPSPQRGEGRVRGHSLPHIRPPIDECLVLGELKDLARCVALFIFTVHMHVDPEHAAL
jgi:hypothetical protein